MKLDILQQSRVLRFWVTYERHTHEVRRFQTPSHSRKRWLNLEAVQVVDDCQEVDIFIIAIALLWTKQKNLQGGLRPA
jgi:hypothetical protein